MPWEPLPPLWLFNKLTWIYILVLLSSISGSVSLGPFFDTPDSACLLGNLDEFRFSLLDPSDGLPFTKIDGQLRKRLDTSQTLPEFRVHKPSGERFSVDVLLNSSYLALFDSGRLGFVDKSSNGVDPVTRGGETFITSIFDISCNGTISIRLPDLLQFNLVYHTPTGGILGRPHGSQKALERRESSALHKFVKRTEQHEKEDPPGTWSPFSFLVGPLKVSDRDQIGYAPRCPLKPFGLESFVKPGARPASFNGCGAENGMKVPDLRFTECCDNHDLCYDDCNKTWNECNNEFRKCMHNRCKNDPTWTEWGCNNLADVYADFVSTRLGAWSFHNSNSDRCTCGCPGGTMNCTDICLRDCRERCNFVDCTKETVTAKVSKSKPTATKNSTANPKKTTTPVTTSTTSLSTTTTSITTSTSSPPGPSPDPDCQDSDSSSWWPFESWSTTPCPGKNATSRAPTETPAKSKGSKTSWWPFNAWFTTTNSPPKHETVAVSSVSRTETTIWWWPFFGDA